MSVVSEWPFTRRQEHCLKNFYGNADKALYETKIRGRERIYHIPACYDEKGQRAELENE